MLTVETRTLARIHGLPGHCPVTIPNRLTRTQRSKGRYGAVNNFACRRMKFSKDKLAESCFTISWLVGGQRQFDVTNKCNVSINSAGHCYATLVRGCTVILVLPNFEESTTDASIESRLALLRVRGGERCHSFVNLHFNCFFLETHTK